MRCIEMVGTPARDHAETVRFIAQPAGSIVANLRMNALLGIINLRRGSEPGIVVEVRRHRLFRIVWLGWINRQANLHMREPTDAAATNKFTAFAKLLTLAPGALLAADLQNSSALRHHVA